MISYNGKALFKLRPDICLRPRKSTTGSVITCDVKWKIVNGRKDSLEQSQADLYQMLAYGLNYQEGEGDMILIYPYHNGFNQPSPHPYEFSHQKENRLRLWVVPFFIGESLQTSELRFPSGAEFI